ncbi:hypothetical protein C8J56DRAFT_245886 [Mycena floridula]|nr:hypothetical protein C8J56DRAFT_245886 [Mycena floridula]
MPLGQFTTNPGQAPVRFLFVTEMIHSPPVSPCWKEWKKSTYDSRPEVVQGTFILYSAVAPKANRTIRVTMREIMFQTFSTSLLFSRHLVNARHHRVSVILETKSFQCFMMPIISGIPVLFWISSQCFLLFQTMFLRHRMVSPGFCNGQTWFLRQRRW